MKITKYLLSSLALVAGGLFTACTNGDNWTPGTPDSANNAGVYFSNETPGTVSVKDETSFDIVVLRTNTEAAVTVPVKSSGDGMFIVPSSVSFAAGNEKANLTVSFDPEDLEYDKEYALGISLSDTENTFTYGNTSLEFTITRPAPWVTLGMATFKEYFLFEKDYTAELQRNELDPNMYRLVDPYTEGLDVEEYYPDGNQADYLTFYVLQPGETLNSTTITQKGLVYFDPACTFYYDAYEDYVWAYHPSAFTNFQTEASWYYNRVISWQDDAQTLPAIVQLAPYYYINGVGGWNNTIYDGVVTIVFPGVVVLDYSVETELQGYFKNLDEENFAVVDVALGADVEYALAATASGDDIDGLLNDILSGAVETTKITASGTVLLPVVDGKNAVVVVSYGAGEAQEYDYFTLKFYAGEAPEVDPLENEWTLDNLYEIEKEDLFKTWIMWGSDYYDEDTDERQPLAYVTFAENDEYDFEDDGDFYDMIDVKGLSMGITDGDDTHQWEYYDGFIFNFYMHYNLGMYKSQYYVNYVPFVSSAGGGYSFYDEMMVGGLVADGYMAMTYSGWYSLGSSPEPDGFLFRAYSDEECNSAAGNFAAIYNVMFEDPKVSSIAAASMYKPVISTVQLNTLASNMAAPKNFVELRGRERAHALIDELLANRKPAAPAEASIEVVSRKGDLKFTKELKVSGNPAGLL